MDVSLTSELEKLVASKVQSGRYESANDVIREGLRLLEDQDRLDAEQLGDVRRKVQVGLDQLDRGEGIPGAQVLAELRQKSAAHRRTQQGE